MNQFIAFTRKEFLHIFRDGRTMLILLVMPLVLICIFGFAVSTEVKHTRVAVVDQMLTPASRELIASIDANPYFEVVAAPHDARGQEECIRNGSADLLLILDEERGPQIIADGSEPNQAQTRVQYLQQLTQQTHPLPLAAGRGEAATASAGAAALPTEVSTPLPHKEGQGVGISFLYNPQLRSEFNFVPGIIGVIVLLICAMMTSISIVREKEMGTMEILLASPLPTAFVVVAKLVPYFVVSCVNLVSILLLSKYVFGLPIGAVGVGWSAVLTFVLLSMIYVAVALALGLLISCAVTTQMAAMLLALLLIVPGIYLSGMVFPVESMPVAFQRVSPIVPTRWYVDGARRLLVQGVALKYVLQDMGVLCLEAVVLVAVSIRLFKTRLE